MTPLLTQANVDALRAQGREIVEVEYDPHQEGTIYTVPVGYRACVHGSRLEIGESAKLVIELEPIDTPPKERIAK